MMTCSEGGVGSAWKRLSILGAPSTMYPCMRMRRGTYNPQPEADVQDFEPVLDVLVVIAQSVHGFLHLALAHLVSGARRRLREEELTDAALPAHHDPHLLLVAHFEEADLLASAVGDELELGGEEGLW